MDSGSLILRQADHTDTAVIVPMIRSMITAMEQIGGHAVAKSNEDWVRIEQNFPTFLQNKDRLFLLAELDAAPIGFGQAEQTAAVPVFEPQKLLHISALYITPAHRRKGIGTRILQELLDWGRDRGCSESELNVLVTNPARKLYNALGFTDFSVKMVQKL